MHAYKVLLLQNKTLKSSLLGLTITLDEIFNVEEKAAKPKIISTIAIANTDKFVNFSLHQHYTP